MEGGSRRTATKYTAPTEPADRRLEEWEAVEKEKQHGFGSGVVPPEGMLGVLPGICFRRQALEDEWYYP